MSFELLDSQKFDKLLLQVERLEQSVERLTCSITFKKEVSEEKLIQAIEAAHLLNVSLSTLHSYKKQGIIPFHRIGRRVYFRESEIVASLKKIN